MLPFYVDFDLPPDDELPLTFQDLLAAESSRELVAAWPGDREWMAGLGEPQRRSVAAGARNIAAKLLEAPLHTAPSRNVMWIRGRTEPSGADELAHAAIEAAGLLLEEAPPPVIVLAVGPNSAELFRIGYGGAIIEPTHVVEMSNERGLPRLALLDNCFHSHLAKSPAWVLDLAHLLQNGCVVSGTASGLAERDLECLALEACGATGPIWKNTGFGWHFLPQRLAEPHAQLSQEVTEIAQLRRKLGPSAIGRSGAATSVGGRLVLGGFGRQAIDIESRQLAEIVTSPDHVGPQVELLGPSDGFPALEALEGMRPARLARHVAEAHARGGFSRAAA